MKRPRLCRWLPLLFVLLPGPAPRGSEGVLHVKMVADFYSEFATEGETEAERVRLLKEGWTEVPSEYEGDPPRYCLLRSVSAAGLPFRTEAGTPHHGGVSLKIFPDGRVRLGADHVDDHATWKGRLGTGPLETELDAGGQHWGAYARVEIRRSAFPSGCGDGGGR